MSSTKPAILGGKPVRTTPFPQYNTIGEEEKRAVLEVLDSGVLSKFLGTWSEDFYGGPRVRRLEQSWADYFSVEHAISMNSATSGLFAALGAAGVGPGDEVVVSPYTMSASAVGPLVYGAVPVFADIDPETFCISPETIRKVLTPRTRVIVAVDIFGHPADFDGIMEIARERNLIVIEDAAQAPGAKYKDRYAGTLAHMGVFSLNYHKTIHSGEGGVVVTDNDEFAERLSLIRNHAEAVVRSKGVTDLTNMIGFNYRMTEIEAAIASEQLKKLWSLAGQRRENALFLSEKINTIPGLRSAREMPECIHGFYVLPVLVDENSLGISRTTLIAALAAEGITFTGGYVEPLYLQPQYQENATRCGPGCSHYEGSVSYGKGICPVVENMYENRLMITALIHAGLTIRDLSDIADALDKVIAAAPHLCEKNRGNEM